MTTTFVLQGGETSREHPSNDKFFQHFTDLVNKDEITIIMCYWSRNRSRWQAAYDRDCAKVLKQTSKKVNFILTENPANLKKGLDSADVLYVSGGDAEPIEKLLPELTWLKEEIKGKVYLGSSMGAFIAGEKYVLSYDAQDTKNVHQGLGFLPVNSLIHWDMENKKEEKVKMLQQVSDLPILTLDECEFVKIIK